MLLQTLSVALYRMCWKCPPRCSRQTLARFRTSSATVIWTEEKYFCVNQKPRRKNEGFWAFNNPHEVVDNVEADDRIVLKVMIFIAIVDGKVSIVHAFIAENGRRKSVNGDCYLKLLRENVWPTFHSYTTRQSLFDGTPAHCTTAGKEFLVAKFRMQCDQPWD